MNWRNHEIATFQIDIGNAKRFDISFVDDKGQKIYPIIIHTAVIGSIERYLFTILDECAILEAKGIKPSLPIWLSPTQVRLIPVKPDLVEFTKTVAEELTKLQVRTDIDDRDESLDKRVREAERNWIPYIVIVGQREISTRSYAVRRRHDGAKYAATVTELEKEISELTKGYPRTSLKLPELVSTRPGYKQM